jgi:hypothetical protein
MAVALVVAVLVVLATHGSLRQLAQLPVEGFGMLFVALGIQAALNIVHIPKARVDDVGFGLLILSYACILGFCFVNLRLRGMAIITIGIALNAIVIALNQGMPANGPTRVDAQGRTVSRVATSVKHRPERPGDVLTVLDDRIVVRVPFHEILSFGDLILALGLIDVCYWGSRRDERERLSVFALSELPAPPRPQPSTPVAAPVPPSTALDVSEADTDDDAEPDEPSPPEIDLTAALFGDPEDAAWHITSNGREVDEPAPPERPRVAHRDEPRRDAPRRDETHHVESPGGSARSDDEVETALWLATP